MFIQTAPPFLPQSISEVLIFAGEVKTANLKREHAFPNVTHVNGPIDFRLPV